MHPDEEDRCAVFNAVAGVPLTITPYGSLLSE